VSIETSDLTVDTNVLMHASNPTEPRYDASICLLNKLIDCETKLVIDGFFDIDGAKNTSHIGNEYLEKLVPGDLGYVVVMNMALTGRVISTSDKIDISLLRKLNQMLSNKRDRTFVRVCINSSSKRMVSHDFEDFSKQKRREMRKSFSILIDDADEALTLLV
jgi:hypothetical protein